MLWLLLASLLVAGAHATTVQQCIAKRGDLPMRTVVEGCVSLPCPLPQGQEAIIHMAFYARRDITSMRTVATAYLNLRLLSIPVPLDLLVDPDTCKYITNTKCPVTIGDVIYYTLRMFIEPFFPVDTSVTIEFQIVDVETGVIVCLRLPVVIVTPLPVIS